MTSEDLKKANDYKNQIIELKHFVYTCEKCWHVIRLKNKRFKITTGYGFLSDEIEVSGDLANRILKVIEDYFSELERKLAEM